MKVLHQSLQWLRHSLLAGNEHGLHSPFIYELYTNVIRERSKYRTIPYDSTIPINIEVLRKKLCDDSTIIQVKDFGSAVRGSQYPRSIASIAKASSKHPQIASLLWRLAKRWQPATILDLGTSLGLTTLYLADAAPQARIHTFEGCGETLNIAKQNFKNFSVVNIIPHEGDLNLTLKETLDKIPSIDVAFFDANHRYLPTMQYFNLCLEKIHNDTLFIFDDIYWSGEMTQAWKEICEHPSVSVTIDLYYVGLVLFRKEQVKENFRLKF